MSKNPYGNGTGGGNGGDGGLSALLGGGGMMMPVIMQGPASQGPRGRDGHADAPPVRTIMAMKFLDYLTQKREKRPMPTAPSKDGGQEFEIVQGEEPTIEEQAAGVAAANVLEHYFTGKLVPNIWEKADLVLAPTAQMTCGCVNSMGRIAQNCPVCSGTGKMTVVLDPSMIQEQALSASITPRTPHPELSEKNDEDSPPRTPRTPRK